MSSATAVIDHTQPWNSYKEIEKTLRARYKLDTIEGFKRYSSVDIALERLKKAMVIAHGPHAWIRNDRWTIKIEENQVKGLKLSTIQEMLEAKISQSEGTEEFQLQPSINDVLTLKYPELLKAMKTTHQEAIKIFGAIEKATQAELDRIQAIHLINPMNTKKCEEIRNALRRLSQAIDLKYQPQLDTDLDEEAIDRLDLYTIDTMLDAKCHKKKEKQISLREALGMSRINPLNFIGYRLGPIYGQPASLSNVEGSLKSNI